MERQRKYKIFSIVALMFAVVGMSLGYAAFSKVLTITASATITPNEEDFKVVTYGLKDEEAYWSFDGSGIFSNESLSENNSFGRSLYTDSTTGTIANITNNKNSTTISNINITFTNKKRNEYQYYFIIKNEGKYDAYLDLTQFEYYSLFNDYNGTCTSIEENADQKAIEEVCKNTYITLVGNTSDSILIEGTEEEPYYKLEVGDYIYLQ